MARYLYSELSKLIQARSTCAASHNDEWFSRHTETIESLVENHMPSGSGFDSGTKIDLDASHAEKLVFTTAYHHMDDGGYYDGWTEHTITVTPSLAGDFNLRVSGRNRNDIKEHVHETFSWALGKDVTYWLLLDRFPQFAVTSKWENEDGTPSQCYQAWYVNGERFWNEYDKAFVRAGQLMELAR